MNLAFQGRSKESGDELLVLGGGQLLVDDWSVIADIEG
jgi:hypothetical protein